MVSLLEEEPNYNGRLKNFKKTKRRGLTLVGTPKGTSHW